jgi:prepilin-type N-terminal cleavage/methylation domain-containing protein
MNRNLRSQSGYSLTEMLVVVAIIGVLALVMVPNFVGFYESNKMKSSMRNFTTDLRSVRQLAISQGKQAAMSFSTGNGQRAYNWYLGDKPFNSVNWTPQNGPGRTRPTKYLDDIAYFPATSTATPQTFTDVLDCSANPCVTGTDGKIDVIFFPDGHVQIPTAVTTGTITIKTNLSKIPKPQYAITVSPSGRVLAQ